MKWSWVAKNLENGSDKVACSTEDKISGNWYQIKARGTPTHSKDATPMATLQASSLWSLKYVWLCKFEDCLKIFFLLFCPFFSKKIQLLMTNYIWQLKMYCSSFGFFIEGRGNIEPPLYWGLYRRKFWMRMINFGNYLRLFQIKAFWLAHSKLFKLEKRKQKRDMLYLN